ncbi:MAG TPA: molybdopterin-binding protein, partial [Gemmatimonadales bacterium]|nr:molybdopterin-binding protein [Gemmatimonadales bacterium]
MNAEIVSIGTELLLGNITDTNATFLTQELAALGINCYWVSQVGDNPARLEEVLRRAWQRSDLIILTGGLGPTEDDVTRETISALLGETMEVQADLEADLRAFFSSRNLVMPEQNRKQATLIPSATVLPNPIGTAPGWWVERAQ